MQSWHTDRLQIHGWWSSPMWHLDLLLLLPKRSKGKMRIFWRRDIHILKCPKKLSIRCTSTMVCNFLVEKSMRYFLSNSTKSCTKQCKKYFYRLNLFVSWSKAGPPYSCSNDSQLSSAAGRVGLPASNDYVRYVVGYWLLLGFQNCTRTFRLHHLRDSLLGHRLLSHSKFTHSKFLDQATSGPASRTNEGGAGPWRTSGLQLQLNIASDFITFAYD